MLNIDELIHELRMNMQRMDLIDQIEDALKAAVDFVESRDEASPFIWHCRAEKGRELLEALGIPYVEK